MFFNVINVHIISITEKEKKRSDRKEKTKTTEKGGLLVYCWFFFFARPRVGFIWTKS